MRVVHVHRMRGIGGSERHLLTLLPALAGLGYDVRFIGLDDPEWDAEPFYAELARGADAGSANAGIAPVSVTRLPSTRDLDPALVHSLRRELHRLDPDLVHTHLVHADVYGALSVLGSRAALVSTKHNDDRFRTGPFRYAEQAISRRAARIIAITHALRSFTVDEVGLPAEKVDVVHYGLDALPVPWRSDAGLELPSEARILLCVARLVPQKGVDVAVSALRHVRERHPATVLVVLGEGSERRRLEGKGVYLPGRVGDVAAWYRRAELVVHPVRWEGFGLALLEAMLASKPVVASAVSSVPEIVVDGVTGLLVPPDDPAALANALIRLLDDRESAALLGRAGLARARSEFSVARMAERTTAVYAAASASR
jgi:glycosyltransferase involved in cell wall biosynthesis